MENEKILQLLNKKACMRAVVKEYWLGQFDVFNNRLQALKLFEN